MTAPRLTVLVTSTQVNVPRGAPADELGRFRSACPGVLAKLLQAAVATINANADVVIMKRQFLCRLIVPRSRIRQLEVCRDP